jgi:8-oxo-dGTP pyrophosphatase MutT (NUDIX family)
MTGPRYAARVLLVDARERLLLLRHARPGDPAHWAPPGGGLLPGETTAEAAARELREEVGITGLVLGRPVWTWRHRYRQSGVLVDQHDTIYAARYAGEVRLGAEAAADGIRDVRWWRMGELARCRDDVWPHGLARLAPDLPRGDPTPDDLPPGDLPPDDQHGDLHGDLGPASPTDLGTTY